MSARRYIEGNIDLLKENRSHPKRNARELLDFIANITDIETEPLNRLEMSKIQSINIYASKFDLRGLKLSIKNNADLLMRADVKAYLNADAKALLEGMSVENRAAGMRVKRTAKCYTGIAINGLYCEGMHVGSGRIETESVMNSEHQVSM